MTQTRLAIDASRNRSGGAISHLIGVLSAADPVKQGFSEIHVWSYKRLLDALPVRSWLKLHNSSPIEKGLKHQLFWQRYCLPRELRNAGCDILLNTDAGTICRFLPSVTMSRDMLSYEPGEITRYRWGRARLRLWLLRYMQDNSLSHATGALFLTRYAATLIQGSTGLLPNVRIIPHGVGDDFRNIAKARGEKPLSENEVRCVYTSNAAPYKHQWNVIKAIGHLRQQGYPVTLTLIGGGSGDAERRIEQALADVDPAGKFVSRLPFLSHADLAQTYRNMDIFVFASSCENMPNTLVEAMVTGLVIACSDRGPMPEILGDGGIYFDPEDHRSIHSALRTLLDCPQLASDLREKSATRGKQFSWERTAEETLRFLSDTLEISRSTGRSAKVRK